VDISSEAVYRIAQGGTVLETAPHRSEIPSGRGPGFCQALNKSKGKTGCRLSIPRPYVSMVLTSFPATTQCRVWPLRSGNGNDGTDRTRHSF